MFPLLRLVFAEICDFAFVMANVGCQMDQAINVLMDRVQIVIAII